MTDAVDNILKQLENCLVALDEMQEFIAAAHVQTAIDSLSRGHAQKDASGEKP